VIDMKNTRKSQTGVAIVEFALILPTLLILTFIVTEVGRALMQYNTLAKSVREGVRYLSVQLPGSGVDQAKNLVVYGNTDGTGSPLVPGLTLSKVPTPTWQPAGAVPQITTVSIRVQGYSFQPMINGMFGLTIGPYTFSDIVATMRSQP
jgi:hypothetical protein